MTVSPDVFPNGLSVLPIPDWLPGAVLRVATVEVVTPSCVNEDQAGLLINADNGRTYYAVVERESGEWVSPALVAEYVRKGEDGSVTQVTGWRLDSSGQRVWERWNEQGVTRV